LPGAACNTPEATACPACHLTVQVEIFPAFFPPASIAKPAETMFEEGFSSCFFHEQKRAVVACDACGRFLCSLCDVELNERHLCPTCLQSGQAKGKIATLETQRMLWDSAALSLALLPIMVSAPLALFCAIYSFSRPSSLVPRTRLRAYCAIVLSVVQIAGWILLFTRVRS